jgi:NADH-quinone oxidoreductase subunit L
MASMFHLFTHAMFKGLLFLGAGAIIHAVHSNDISFMGGLRKYMPVTHITFLVACLAIAGIPPFSGFFSKDEILTACYDYSLMMGVFMSLVAALTAFYMFRLYYLIFWGKSYYDTQFTLLQKSGTTEKPHTPHEAPLTMLVPLLILAAISCVAGFIPFGKFISSNGEAYEIHLNIAVAVSSILLAATGIAIATAMYLKGQNKITMIIKIRSKKFLTVAYNRFYMDELWIFVTKKIIFRGISRPIAWFDKKVIDGFMDLLATSTQIFSRQTKRFQSGNIQSYCIWFLLGVMMLAFILIFLI